LYNATFAHLPLAALSSRSGPAFCVGRSRPGPRSRADYPV